MKLKNNPKSLRLNQNQSLTLRRTDRKTAISCPNFRRPNSLKGREWRTHSLIFQRRRKKQKNLKMIMPLILRVLMMKSQTASTMSLLTKNRHSLKLTHSPLPLMLSLMLMMFCRRFLTLMNLTLIMITAMTPKPSQFQLP